MPDLPAALALLAKLAAAWMLFGLIRMDLTRRRLPNVLVGSYAALFLPWALGSGMGWSQFGVHGALALAVGALMAVLFALRKVGGGDVKLWAALMLWAGPSGALPTVLIATLTGGIIGLLGLGARAILRHNRRARGRALWLMLTADRGIPYGVGLALAGLVNLLATGVG
ncbi:MAG: prepilin peptidase [Castellaniella sp.]